VTAVSAVTIIALLYAAVACGLVLYLLKKL
jgi:hypothetical protein